MQGWFKHGSILDGNILCCRVSSQRQSTVTTEEDKKIIEHTARGVLSRYYVPGPIAPMEQNELRYISWYLDEISRA